MYEGYNIHKDNFQHFIRNRSVLSCINELNKIQNIEKIRPGTEGVTSTFAFVGRSVSVMLWIHYVRWACHA